MVQILPESIAAFCCCSVCPIVYLKVERKVRGGALSDTAIRPSVCAMVPVP